MAVTKNIFETSSAIFNAQSKLLESPEYGFFDDSQYKQFNTYKYWEPFYVPTQGVIDPDKKDDKGNPEKKAGMYKGTKSLFNNFNALLIDNDYRIADNMPLLDSADIRKRQRKNNECTIRDLVEKSADGKHGRQLYNYSDFAYCKYLGRISNNYLITLRRFAAPCGDKIDITPNSNTLDAELNLQHHAPDIGRMVTWMGTPDNALSSILTYTVGMEWEEMKADIQQIEAQSDNGGMLASIFNASNPKYQKMVQQGIAGNNFAGKAQMDRMLNSVIPGNGSTAPPYSNAEWLRNYDNNKTYGPLDVIDKTMRRKRGLNFSQTFTLTFDYQLRSYNGINGKSAMTDLLANILTTTYATGTFWGGERRFVGAAQDNIFANLPIFKLAETGGLNNPSAVYKAFIDSVQDGAKAATRGIKGETTWEKIKNVAKDLGGMLLGGALNKLGRPQKYAVSSLLSPAPTGCWHLTIGNPNSPILEVGNLILKSAEITHYGPLGLDDFPTGLKVKVTLEHGKPRDIMGIEQMYRRGDSRIYAPMADKIKNMYENATEIKNSNSTYAGQQYNKLIKAASSIKEMFTGTQDALISLPAELTAKANTPNNISGVNDVFKKYFGLDDEDFIVKVSQELMYGADPYKNAHTQSGNTQTGS